MKAQVSWFVLFVTRIVAADWRENHGSDYIPDCKLVVEAPPIYLWSEKQDPLQPDTLEATPISGIYTYFVRPTTLIKGVKSRPHMILTKKIPVPGKKNYNYDDTEYDDSEVKIKYLTLHRKWAIRFKINGLRTAVIVQAEKHFCLLADDDTPKHWAIYNEETEQIIGWSMLVDDITGVSCNSDVGELRYISSSTGLEESYEPYELPMIKTFKMAYECATYLNELVRSTGIASKATAATLEIGTSQATCKYWHPSHDNMHYDADVSTEGICFLEEAQNLRSTPNFGDLFSAAAFSSCLMVHFGDHLLYGPYVVKTTSLQSIVMRKKVILNDVDGVDKLGSFEGYQASYYPDQGRILFDNEQEYFEVDEFPCNPGNTNKGPFTVINPYVSTTNREVMFYTISGPEDLDCSTRQDYGNRLNCESGVTYWCLLGDSTRYLETCINQLDQPVD